MKSIKIVTAVLVGIFFAVSGSIVSAHEGHDHHQEKGPHAGEIVMVGSYHYEMLVKPAEIDLYVLDKKLQTLPLKGIEGSLQLQLANNVNKEIPLIPVGDYFKAAVDLGAVKSFIAVATLKIDGKENVGRFRHTLHRDRYTNMVLRFLDE